MNFLIMLNEAKEIVNIFQKVIYKIKGIKFFVLNKNEEKLIFYDKVNE